MNRTLPILLAALLALPLLATPASAAAVCTAGRPAAYCVEAVATTSVTCTLTATTYACTLEAERYVRGSTRSPLPGDVLAITRVSTGVCNGPGLCAQTLDNPNATCGWATFGHSCTIDDAFAFSSSGTLNGCLYVWVELELEGHTHPGTPQPTLAAQKNDSVAFFDSCA